MVDLKILSSPVCQRIIPPASGIVIFGASGDLTKRKLLPALFNIFRLKQVTENFFILGFARSKLDNESFRETVKSILLEKHDKIDVINDFISRCYYISGDYNDGASYRRLKNDLDVNHGKYKTLGNIVFYLSTPPSLYNVIPEKLAENGLIKKGQNSDPFQRIVIEKPFGRDYKSAVSLNNELLKNFDDSQIYRIDHYLGKDTVQNILVFRFANSIFENVWNRNYIDNIQITAFEELGIGSRSGYFEQTGLVRDMLQNHMFQLLALIGMEPPASFDADKVRNEKVKLLQSISPFDLDKLENYFIRAQYDQGKIKDQVVPSYKQESGVKADSCVETYFATKIYIDNYRWSGTPFYLRSGKRLQKKLTQIAVVFKEIPYNMFGQAEVSANVLIFSIQPDQNVSLTLTAKAPGSKLCIIPLQMSFNYKDVFGDYLTDDYENLLIDAMNGDQTLFWRKDGIETSWNLLTPILQEWENCSENEKKSQLYYYPSGSLGPEIADEFIRKDGKNWILY